MDRAGWTAGAMGLALTAVAAGTIAPSGYAASQPSCGATITKSVTLRKDLVNCPGNGLVVGADHLTIDLNGHKLDGTGNGDGIRLDGRARVKIRNGTIQQFDDGIRLENGSGGNLIKRVRALHNASSGIRLDASSANRVRRNVASGNGGPGIQIVGPTADGNVLRGNTVTHTASNAGIFVTGATNTRLEDNDVSSNQVAGIRIDASAAATVLRDNRASGNDGGGDGIHVSATDLLTVLTRNRANGNANLGIFAASGITDGGGNRARHNGNPAQCQGVRCKK